MPLRRVLFANYCLLLAGGLSLAGSHQALTAEPVRFESQVQPILDAKCAKCHGQRKRQAGLNLSTGADLLRGAESGAVVVPGKPDESPLFEKIHEGEMPPEGNPQVSSVEADLIRRWIAEGAKLSDGSRGPTVTQHQIVPLMLLRCTVCHGGRRREGDLDLRTKAGMLRGGKSGPAVVPGNPDESLLVRRIRAEEMPPRRQLVSVSVKPMESAELKLLESWIALGLPESPVGPDVPTVEPDRLVVDEDREFWAFRAPAAASPPLHELDAAAREQATDSVDAFLLAKLQKEGLTFAPLAERATRIRRVTFDLLGLPPTPEEVDAFVLDSSPTAYEQLVERLLASPRYGERWGRHWLDVAGYADSEGAQNEDRVRPNMWRYRDYVVRAFNADKPYDRFLHEQLAGDELANYEQAETITDEIYDNLVATGFLRTAPDRTFANITNFVPDRLEVIADEIQILGSAVLGLTLHCARCHSHKFDPLPQRDYYRLAAALKDALDEHDWLGPDARQLNFVTTVERQAWQQHEREINERVELLRQQLTSAEAEAKKKLEEQIRGIEAQRKPEPKIRSLWSRGDPSPTYILQRGNYLTAGAEVGPGPPSMLTDGKTPFPVEPPWPGAHTTGRRLALARWLTQPDHPLTSRVLVNRVWRHHFGAGIVTTLGNFGQTGAPPSHVELLDWLARDFVAAGWSLKDLHRRLVTSRAYQQSSQLTEHELTADPDNRYLSRMPLRRLEAEPLRDAMLAVAGQLDTRPFGPPDDVDVRGDGLVTVKQTNRGGRRSIYVLHRRTKLPTMLENFDSPQMGPNCIDRAESNVAPQALHLLNNAAVHELAARFAERVASEAGAEPRRQVELAHRLAFGVVPSPDELQAAGDALDQLTRHWIATLAGQADPQREATRRALQNYCHAILNSAAFVYVD